MAHGWLPIDAAPRDGTVIFMLSGDVDGIIVGSWGPVCDDLTPPGLLAKIMRSVHPAGDRARRARITAESIKTGRITWQGNALHAGRYVAGFTPTCWRPLPTASDFGPGDSLPQKKQAFKDIATCAKTQP